MDSVNLIHHKNFLENDLPSGCAKVIIADPPYYKVKGEFDFIWPSMAAYLNDVRKWAAECFRLLADNGTLYWYGHAKKIAYSQIVLDELFGEPISCPVWEKIDCQTRKGIADYRTFAPVTERLIMYTKEQFNLTGCISVIRDYIRSEITKARGKVLFREINEAMGVATNGGGVASACLSLEKTEPAMITEELYIKLQHWLNPDMRDPGTAPMYLAKFYSLLRHEYDLKRAEYELERRYFNNYLKLTDVLKFSQESAVGADYEHETKKPETLSRALILTSSRPDDLVLVPFAGSGTECAMAAASGRPFIGFDIDEKHVITSNQRVRPHLAKPQLFY